MNALNLLRQRKQLYLLSLLILLSLEITSPCFAQVPTRKFLTHAVQSQSLQEELQLEERKRSIEKFFQQNRNRVPLNPSPIVIPIVFHMIHHQEMEALSEAQI